MNHVQQCDSLEASVERERPSAPLLLSFFLSADLKAENGMNT